MRFQKIFTIFAFLNFIVGYAFGAAAALPDEIGEEATIPRERFLVVNFSLSPSEIAESLIHQEGKTHLILLGDHEFPTLFEDAEKRDLISTLLTHTATGVPLEETPYESVSIVGGRIDQATFNWLGDIFLAPEETYNTMFPHLRELNFNNIKFRQISTGNYYSTSLTAMELSAVRNVPPSFLSHFPCLERVSVKDITIHNGNICQFLAHLYPLPIKYFSLHSIPMDMGSILILVEALKEKPLNVIHISGGGMDREKLIHLATLGAFTPTPLSIIVEDSFTPRADQLRDITRAWEAYPSAHLRLRLGSAP